MQFPNKVILCHRLARFVLGATWMKKAVNFGVFVTTVTLLYFFVPLRMVCGDFRFYIAIREVVQEAKNEEQTNVSKRFVKPMGGMRLGGTYYLSEGKKLVVVVEQPEPSVWILDDIQKGGHCYLAYGKGTVEKIAGANERLCTH